MATGFERTKGVPKHYTMQPNGPSALYPLTYTGFVKVNTDALSMGRLMVWIPDLSTDPVNGLFQVNYCSPFAGATPIVNVNKSSKTDSQTSYGFWAIPPDIDNEVIVQFINGDPNRGIWIGCLYQQYMNNMVPGIPDGPTTTTDGKETAPVQEYNKYNLTEAAKDSPLRPPFVPLTTGLLNEGLSNDSVRGTSTSSARRSTKSSVIGILTPGQSQFVMDDSPENTMIRLRTASGAQILINDNIGMIYAISKNGNSWAEIGDDGVNVYSSSNISIRSQSDLNFHADGKVNIFGSKGINLTTSAGVSIQGIGSVNVVSGGPLNMQSKDQMSLLSGQDLALSSSCQINLKADCNVAIQATQCIGVTANCGLYLKGAPIFSNGPTGPTPIGASEANITPIVKHTDRELDVKKGYPELSTKTIVSTLPSHEPWEGHSGSGTGSTTRPVNLNNSERIQSGEGGTEPSPNDILPGQPDLPAGNDTDYWLPVNGTVGQPYGGPHPGVDIRQNIGNSIIATKSGTVTFAGFGTSGKNNGYGNSVTIDHGNNLKSIYGHMVNLPVVSKGDKVSQGQMLGNVGSTGMSSGPHLHFELRQGGSHFDPGSVLPTLGQRGTKITAGDPNPDKKFAANKSATTKT